MTDIDLNSFRHRIRAAQQKADQNWKVHGPAYPSATRRHLRLPRLPWILILTVAALFLSFKALMMIRIGEHEYRAKLASFADPDNGEKIALTVLEPDQFSLWLHDVARPYLERTDCRQITKRPRGDAAQPLC